MHDDVLQNQDNKQEYLFLEKRITNINDLYLNRKKCCIEEVIDSFVKCIINKYKIVKRGCEYRLIIEGVLCIKIHYCSSCECGLVLSETFTEPFCTEVGIGCKCIQICGIESTAYCKKINLMGCRELECLTIADIDIKAKYYQGSKRE